MLPIITSIGSLPTADRTVSLPADARVLDFLAPAAAPCIWVAHPQEALDTHAITHSTVSHMHMSG